MHATVAGAFLALSLLACPARPEVLTPPYFNLALNRRITATATCGEGLEEPELYCKLVGANSESAAEYVENVVIHGQVCDRCDPNNPEKSHEASFAVDGEETWWQSPPLSRGMKYNEINLTIDLGQEFHVAYVIIKMGNSPRPGVWVLERSADHGQTYQPWQYFADTVADCESYFGKESIKPITSDDSVICDTSFSKIVPLENGEIFVRLLTNRPSANNFFNSYALQEFTRATNVRFRLLRVKNLLGHLMSVARQDPTTTRRYFYSIKDVSIGGRCRCNGHADLCDVTDPHDKYHFLCRCQHNTYGDNCEKCSPGFEQKAWSQSKYDKLFECEPCNCFGHSETCIYDEAVDALHQSIDIHGKYEGGGVCQNCRDHTTGINCNKCDHGFYRPIGKNFNETDMCQPCDCNVYYSTGNCSEGFGKCECKEAYAAPDCDRCSEGYYGYPNCKPCDCFLDGTRGRQCETTGGQCPCKQNFGGKLCYECAEGFYNFPECKPCNCNSIGSKNLVCDQKTGQCACQSSFGNLSCDQCNHGYYGFPTCSFCNCDLSGSLPEICDKNNGQCLCKEGYSGPRCDKCLLGYYGYPECKPCSCSEHGSSSQICDASGKCPCLSSFAGKTCEQCSPGYYKYPECKPCDCNSHGSIGVSCDNEGKCMCKQNFMRIKCDQCKEGLYNFPLCEECNCNPAGVLSTFAGCGSLPAGELCQCKSRVHGRICDKCRDLFWNLQPSNPDGCEECDCFMPGVLSGVGVCNTKSGQCVCKPSATSRRCDECSEGFYSLNENSLFGCTECGCNIGGSVNEKCDKNDGQCLCQSRITGRACTEPMQLHYFPTLYQFSYEAEDGRTPEYTPVRYGFDEKYFPEYSWKGYAVFSQLQSEIVHELNIDKPSLYRIVLRYVNLNNETVVGLVSVIPETPNDINSEQKYMVQLKPTKVPTFVTVSGVTGNIPSPFEMNPGRWAVSIKIENNLFVDYFVILPAEYYEGSILVDKVLNPCVVDNIESGLCRHFEYPSISKFNQVKSTSAVNSDDETPVEFIEDFKQLDVLGVPKLPIISEAQPELKLELSVDNPGPYVVLVNYVTSSSIQTKAIIEIQVDEKMNSDKAILYSCHHTTVCRQAAVDATDKVAIFDITKSVTKVTLKGGKDHSKVGIESIVAVPLDKWSLDYINPNPSCVVKDGKCIQSFYPTPPDTKKIEFKNGNEAHLATIKPKDIFDSSASLIILDQEDSNVDLAGKVPGPGAYVFIVHFYQPDFPAFEMNAFINNGQTQTYEAVLPIKHCPSNSGCRSIVKQANGNTQFQLTENFLLTLKKPNHKSVWLEYILVVPAQQYSDSITKELPFDYTSLFISKCGSNHFYINTSTTGFCKEATFSLTTAYNSGALPCACDSDGSLSYECDPYGGQCQCKPNVIGRQCDACKTGYFGFPNCQSCDCPSVATCETTTGECICPPHVVGKNCDQCEPMTYGFDPIIGCEECKCNYFGVENGNLQCDLFNGSCECKQNIVGRSCDRCRAGYSDFPHCNLCDCDYRGTTSEICSQVNSECYCKSNVEGQACDLCKEGTFNIQEKNDKGCLECFCFDKSKRCQSSNLYRTEIIDMENWSIKTVSTKPISIQNVEVPLDFDSEEGVLGIDLTSKEFQEKITYFLAPQTYLGNQLKSYGGFLNYTIHYTSNLFGSAVSGPDVILYGHDTYLFYFSLEQPASNTLFPGFVELVEQNFVHVNRLLATREQMMLVLQNLNGIFIRATYWEPTVTTKISKISLDTAQEDYIPSKEIALSVEQCQCPPNYVGLSCEECADGFYRLQTGPYGGHCIPCQCNGHANTCDKITGICSTCKHNTEGDHCEKCIVGYHGNATMGSPNDCLICACPLPIASNNFATGCEVSPDGNEISCDCIPGYFGARCESCNAGFYGSPQIPGEVCKECQCSGNINKEDPGSCDSITGKCTRCLNNTFGETCQYCRPGYFGDAVNLKDCQACDCDKCGMNKCDNYNGKCVCQPNVEGEKCDRCAVNHYGFGTCKGCKPCECALASESSQCDENTGMCRCKPGVGGRTCDRCKPGYWNYTEDGCISCDCISEYSVVGTSCNPKTGQCECLPDVIGDKCNHCPHRWVLIQPEPNIDQTGGCFECDNCTHSLLDATDSLFGKLYPVWKEFESASPSLFTVQRLSYLQNKASGIEPKLTNLTSSNTDSFPLNADLTDYQNKINNLNRESKSTLRKAVDLATKSNETLKNVEDVDLEMNIIVSQTTRAVSEVKNLAQSLQEGAGPQIDSALTEAQNALENIKNLLPDMTKKHEEYDNALEKSDDYYNNMTSVKLYLENPANSSKLLKNKIKKFEEDISDITNHTNISHNNASLTASLNNANKELLKKQKDFIDSLLKLKDTANENLKNLINMTKEASDDLGKSTDAFAKLSTENESMKGTKSEVESAIEKGKRLNEELRNGLSKAKEHADKLKEQADLMELLVKNSTSASETAIIAANSYKNIEAEIGKALNVAKNASIAAENAVDKSKGLDERVAATKQDSTKLFADVAKNAFDQIQGRKDELSRNDQELNEVENLKNKADEKEKIISEKLEKISPANINEDINMEMVLTDTEKSRELIESLEDITSISIPNNLNTSQNLNTDKEQSKIHSTTSEGLLEKIKTNLTELINSVDDLNNKTKELFKDKSLKSIMELLQKDINECRNIVNNVEVGISLSKNSSLELRNPENLMQQGINTNVSIYFKTNQSDGLILYLGNEMGSNTKTRRGKSNDFMALQVQNNYLVLLMDIGSGVTPLISKKTVSDDQWYKAIIERTRKTVKLTILEDVEKDSPPKEHVQEAILEGNSSFLNLNQDHSKLFIGALNVEQPGIVQQSLEGQVEHLMFGNTLVGLWNFVDFSGVNTGSIGRDKLLPKPTIGYRMNGEGYIAISSALLIMDPRSAINLNIKTTSTNGLLFLAFKNNTFLSIELEEGRIVFRQNLGEDTVSTYPSDICNDDKWHAIEASRAGQEISLKVDGKKVGGGSNKGSSFVLQSPDKLYFGGYEGCHGIKEVSEYHYDGCIKEIYINGNPVSLETNISSSGITPGCPAKIANFVSFEPGSKGYIKLPNITASDNIIDLLFRFKTNSSDGLLVYGVDHPSVFSLEIKSGVLIFKSGGIQVSSQTTLYNDDKWHVVLVAHTPTHLILLVDDIDSFQSENPNPVRFLRSDFFFGGKPSEVDAVDSFVGCIGDVTFNEKIINFAELTDFSNAIIGRCAGLLLSGKMEPKCYKPTNLLWNNAGVKARPIVQTTFPTTISQEVTTTLRTPVGSCALPVNPPEDSDVNTNNGYRFGNLVNSRLEYDSLMEITNGEESEMSIQVKTNSPNGIIAFAYQPDGTDFMAVYLNDGKVNYHLKCNSEPSKIIGEMVINDEEWHSVKWTRSDTNAELFIDTELAQSSVISNCEFNAASTLYLGGTNPSISNHVIDSIGINDTFEGCLRKFNLNSKDIGHPDRKFGVSKCSEKVESGAFFYGNGGFIRLYEKFNVAKKITIKMEIKPRSVDGILVSIPSKKNSLSNILLLEIKNGTLSFVVDSGAKGPMSATYTPPSPYFFCDGSWHTIKAERIKNVLLLTVNQDFKEFEQNQTNAGKSASNIKPLFIGGNPQQLASNQPNKYLGCIRNVEISNYQPETKMFTKFPTQMIRGNVTLSVCPTY